MFPITIVNIKIFRHYLTGTCSGRDPYNTLIGDDVVVPTVAPGKYVLGIRWDCEKSAQVWTNCADIEIEE